MSKFNMKVTPEIEKLTQICRENDKLDLSLYGKYDVKRGLRDINGDGVYMLAQLGVSNYVYNMLPYVMTLIVLAFTSKKSRAPKAEGIPYDKGER